MEFYGIIIIMFGIAVAICSIAIISFYISFAIELFSNKKEEYPEREAQRLFKEPKQPTTETTNGKMIVKYHKTHNNQNS